MFSLANQNQEQSLPNLVRQTQLMMLLAPLLKGNFMKSNFSYKNIVKNFIRPWRNPKMELDNKPLSLLVLLKKGGRTTLKKIGGQISLLINSL